MTNHRDVPQQHEGCKEESGYQCPPEQYLDALRQKSLHNTIHHLRKVDRPGTQAHAVDITRTTRKSVSNVILHATSVQRRAVAEMHEVIHTSHAPMSSSMSTQMLYMVRKSFLSMSLLLFIGVEKVGCPVPHYYIWSVTLLYIAGSIAHVVVGIGYVDAGVNFLQFGVELYVRRVDHVGDERQLVLVSVAHDLIVLLSQLHVEMLRC